MGKLTEKDLIEAGYEIREDQSGELKIRKREQRSNGASSGSSGSSDPKGEAEAIKLRILKARAREGEAKATDRERKLDRELAEQGEQGERGGSLSFEDIGSLLYIGGVSIMLSIIGGSILLLLAFILIGIVGSLIGIW